MQRRLSPLTVAMQWLWYASKFAMGLRVTC